jgi:MerR family transcriptional regulator, redox-sensitive transcriptional activator SoxR
LIDDATLSIGQVAGRAGLRVSAIRYYEAEGLLPEALRVGGRRRYSEDVFARLGVIDVAKRAGFSLEDIRTLLDARDAGEPAHTPLQELAERKLPEVEELIERAEAVRLWLEAARACGCETLDVCALFRDGGPLPPR